MNDFNKNFSNKFCKKLLEEFHSSKVLPSFEHPIKGFGEAFDRVGIPWYLKPFKKQIRRICSDYVTNQKWPLNKNDIVTFRRPTSYRDNNEEHY